MKQIQLKDYEILMIKRRRLKLTLSEVANAIGYKNYQLISMFENGRGGLTSDKISELESFLNSYENN